MSLLIIADSQVERAWRNVRQNRELLWTAIYVPVKRIGQLHDGVRAMTAQVRSDHLFHYKCYIYYTLLLSASR